MSALTGRPVRVHVPATSANLGPGFDALGLALGLGDDVVVTPRGEGLRIDVEGEGAADVPRDERHLVARVLLATLGRLGVAPGGLHLACTNRIPHARGLGSSAAAIVAGLLAARALVDDGASRLGDAEVLDLATAEEGHPDNVAACLLGGLTLAWDDGGRTGVLRHDPDPGTAAVAYVPPGGVSTHEVRRLLPATVPHADAAANAGRAALLVQALTRRPDLLLPATQDRLHQAYRAPAMPGSAALVERLRADGVPAVVSGAGPTVLALVPAADAPGLAAAAPEGFAAHVLALRAEGATAAPA
ncbi:homoserine kinase [Vallicoccus soli]|uniref:Homoserine kinase n=1 Tax=Vallicoccus soli TaxID=2339232 RepID=A0A3A3Z5A9_9ACTN|nr:homoserine kinase [Vallicoccus soli]RJK98138.1 homoserine kinase [Vallicoccus soli]